MTTPGSALPARRTARRALAALLIAAGSLMAAFSPPCVADSGLQDLRFAQTLGVPAAASLPSSASASASAPPAAPRFAGAALAPCSGVDLHGFLAAFDPHELLDELRDSILGGAQAAVSNYLLALAYSAPTMASILDMSDKTLNARYAAFARTCATQHADIGSAGGAGRLAQAASQCFSAQILAGTPPTEAMRRCTGARTAALSAAAAALPTLQFLQRYAPDSLTPRLANLLDLMPDVRIEQGGLQVRPPRLTVADAADLWTARARKALDLIDGGVSPSSIGPCAPATAGAGGAVPCLPESSTAVATSTAFRSAMLLKPDAREVFKDALAGQMAVVQVYSDLLELTRRIDSIQLGATEDAPAAEWQARRRQLQQEAAGLLAQAELRARLQEARSSMARMQIAAVERARDDLKLQSARDAGPDLGTGSGLRALLPLLGRR